MTLTMTPRRRAQRLAVAAVVSLAVIGSAGSAAADPGGRADVYRFADGSQVAGAWSSLSTGPAGAKMTLQTSELPAGHTVTVWWVIFNEPGNCSHPEGALRCGPGDLPIFGGDDSAQTSVLYAAGHEIGAAGRASFSGRLAAGATTDALWGPGLVNQTGADIHLVVHDHGDLPPDQQAEGIHNFGPCDPACTDIQFSAHEQ